MASSFIRPGASTAPSDRGKNPRQIQNKTAKIGAVRSVEEVKAILKEHKAEVVQKYKVREIGIFGSFVRSEEKRRSDIDILVEFAPRNIPGLLKLIEMEMYLERQLKKKVDVVEKSGIRPELKKGILKEVVYI